MHLSRLYDLTAGPLLAAKEKGAPDDPAATFSFATGILADRDGGIGGELMARVRVGAVKSATPLLGRIAAASTGI